MIADYRRQFGGRLWASFALMVLGAIAEGFGLLMIVPLASLAMGGGSLGRFGDFLRAYSPGQRFAVALLLFVGAMAARSVLLYFRDVVSSRLIADYEASLRLRAAAALARRGWGFASRIGQDGMQSLLLNDVPRAGQAIHYLQQFAISTIMFAVQLAVTFLLSPALTLAALCVMAIGALVSVRATRRGVVRGIRIMETQEESAGSGFRLQAGLKAALAQGTVPQFLSEYRATLGAAATQNVAFIRDYSISRQTAAFFAALAAAILLFTGSRLLHLPFPVMVASLVLFARMSAPAQALQQATQQIAAFAPSFAAIVRRLGPLDPAPVQNDMRQPLDWHELRVDSAGFEHSPGFGVAAASLSLKRGEWLGLKGASGGGKTTLVDLVAGLVEPGTGRILVDGEPLKGDLLARWRSGLAYVGQEGSVFNDSVRGNLQAEGAASDEAALWDALTAVGLAERVRALPRGLDEPVGDRGSQLSGGERQRIVIARALLRRPTLLILDEATAALDPDGEASLLASLRALQPRPAAILVAHRDSTLAACERVLAMQGGRVGPE